MELDDWELSAEDLEHIERQALNTVSQRHSSSSAATSSSSPSAFYPSSSVSGISQTSLPQQQQPRIGVSNTSRSGLASDRVAFISSRHKVAEKTLQNSAASKDLTRRDVKLFIHAAGGIAAKFSYDSALVDAFRKVPRASWNAKEKLWLLPVSSLSIAEDVLQKIPNVEIEHLDPLPQRALAAAQSMPDLRDRYIHIPISIELKLLPFQREGVRFILQHGGRALLADEMGLGKTLQAIAVASCLRDSWPVLVLTPSSLRLHWASAVQDWLGIPSSDILVILSQSSSANHSKFRIVYSNMKGAVCLNGVFNIISYDAVPKLSHVLMASNFKVVIADESHFLKNAQAKRTTSAIPVIQKAQYAILLSGTPALSRPVELFKQLEALYPDVYKSIHEYGNRYCKGGVFGLYQGASNHEEMHNLMKATVMIRRLKKDVLSELPVKRRQQVFLDLAEKEMKQVTALFRELDVVKSKREACNTEEEAKSCKYMEKSLLNKIYAASAEARIPAVLDYLGTVIEAGCKFLIFAHHQPLIESIHEFLLKKKVGCIRIDGSIPTSAREALVSEFQEKENIIAAVLSIKAGGVGLTLTAASTVIFAELAWTPGDIIQAEDRVHRIGQVSSVNVYYLLASGTVDDIIWDVVQSKLENLGQMLDGEENILEVSECRLGGSSSQTTLDAYIKRCNKLDDAPQRPRIKCPRY